jgi:carotenoid cleavage dioxygenase
MQGNYAPVSEELTVTDLVVRGSIPTELNGRYLRNGANPANGPSVHWFDGDGMIHGVRLRDGKAEWYRNRWVRTKMLEGGIDRTEAYASGDYTVGRANTSIIGHAGRILALEEGSWPMELDADLDTVGPTNYGGKLTTVMTAHPKLCPVTGELHGFGYGFMPPYLTYHRISAAGELVQTEIIDVPGSTMMHDFAISRNYAIFMDLPVVFSLDAAARGGFPYTWDESYGARIGLLRRGAAGSTTQWFEVEPQYVFHTLNAYDDGDDVVVDVGRHDYMWKESANDFPPSYLHRWRLNTATGRASEETIDQRGHGFPRVDDRVVGLRHRYGWAVMGRPGAPAVFGAETGVTKYDLESGTNEFHDYGPGRTTDEPSFVPTSASAGEDEGYVLSYVYDGNTDRSELVVLDASDITADPVAAIEIPARIPFGFHGSWVADS